MARKRAAKVGKGRGQARPRRAVPPTGPLTLEQARALARGEDATRARRRSLATEVTPGSVGAERKKLNLQRRDEVRRRIREYKATLRILKKRGVKGLGAAREAKAEPEAAGPGAAATRGRGPRVGDATGQPVQIFAEGDSWFDYPVPFFGGGIIPRLEQRLGVPILNLAKAGDEVRYMLGVEERKLLVQQFTDGCPAGGSWDVMLFSGGGNDIVDNPMALWIRDFDPALPPADHIHAARFDAALALVRAGYEDLIELRNRLSPTTHLVFHAYDYAIPDGRGICHLGPWLRPTFELRKFPSRQAGFEVLKAMLQRFAGMLQGLADANPGVTFLNGQGTLAPQTSSWHNELHPSRDGFKLFAQAFHHKLKQLFPGRVL